MQLIISFSLCFSHYLLTITYMCECDFVIMKWSLKRHRLTHIIYVLCQYIHLHEMLSLRIVIAHSHLRSSHLTVHLQAVNDNKNNHKSFNTITCLASARWKGTMHWHVAWWTNGVIYFSVCSNFDAITVLLFWYTNVYF